MRQFLGTSFVKFLHWILMQSNFDGHALYSKNLVYVDLLIFREGEGEGVSPLLLPLSALLTYDIFIFITFHLLNLHGCLKTLICMYIVLTGSDSMFVTLIMNLVARDIVHYLS